jgi:hypothetical protein
MGLKGVCYKERGLIGSYNIEEGGLIYMWYAYRSCIRVNGLKEPPPTNTANLLYFVLCMGVVNVRDSVRYSDLP